MGWCPGEAGDEMHTCVGGQIGHDDLDCDIGQRRREGFQTVAASRNDDEVVAVGGQAMRECCADP